MVAALPHARQRALSDSDCRAQPSNFIPQQGRGRASMQENNLALMFAHFFSNYVAIHSFTRRILRIMDYGKITPPPHHRTRRALNALKGLPSLEPMEYSYR